MIEQSKEKQWNHITVERFDLLRTLRSGQCFLYEENHDHIVVFLGNALVRLRQNGRHLYYQGKKTEQEIRLFLGIVPEQEERHKEIFSDPILQDMKQYATIRVMRIDLYESILAFICSTQSNIPRIRMNLIHIAKRCGRKDGPHLMLPQAGIPLKEEDLILAGTGYRAPYLAETSQRVTPAFLAKLKTLPYPQAHMMLCALPGIGPKVADCICLFGLGHTEAFPVDVHIHRAMRSLYPKSRLVTPERVKKFAQKKWGKNAGIVQQIIFEWAKENLSPKNRAEEQE